MCCRRPRISWDLISGRTGWPPIAHASNIFCISITGRGYLIDLWQSLSCSIPLPSRPLASDNVLSRSRRDRCGRHDLARLSRGARLASARERQVPLFHGANIEQNRAVLPSRQGRKNRRARPIFRPKKTCPSLASLPWVTKRASPALTEGRITTRDAGDPRPCRGEVHPKLPRVLRPARRLSGDGPLLAHRGDVFWPARPNPR